MVLNSRRLRELRGGRSQDEVATAVGTVQGTLSHYESGNAKRPDVEILQRLADYYGGPLEEIYLPDLEPGAESISEDDALLVQLITLWAQVPTETRQSLVELVRRVVETPRRTGPPAGHQS